MSSNMHISLLCCLGTKRKPYAACLVLRFTHLSVGLLLRRTSIISYHVKLFFWTLLWNTAETKSSVTLRFWRNYFQWATYCIENIWQENWFKLLTKCSILNIKSPNICVIFHLVVAYILLQSLLWAPAPWRQCSLDDVSLVTDSKMRGTRL